MSTILEVSNLTKRYGKKVAVNQISFSIEAGQIFGLLGPNGSGKTTTLSTILTLLKATGGNIKLFETDDLVGALRRIGVLLESASYYPELSAQRNMRISCSIKNVPESAIDGALERVGLLEEKKNKVKTFSFGYETTFECGIGIAQ